MSLIFSFSSFSDFVVISMSHLKKFFFKGYTLLYLKETLTLRIPASSKEDMEQEYSGKTGKQTLPNGQPIRQVAGKGTKEKAEWTTRTSAREKDVSGVKGRCRISLGLDRSGQPQYHTQSVDGHLLSTYLAFSMFRYCSHMMSLNPCCESVHYIISILQVKKITDLEPF